MFTSAIVPLLQIDIIKSGVEQLHPSNVLFICNSCYWGERLTDPFEEHTVSIFQMIPVLKYIPHKADFPLIYPCLPPYQAFTFKWIKIFRKVLVYDVCISFNAF